MNEKPAPTMVTLVPPCVLPETGTIDVTLGGTMYVN
jgi:hypothetical protein